MIDDDAVAKALFAFWRAGDRAASKAYEAELAADPQDRWRPVLRSFAALWEIEDIAAAAGLEERYRPRIWWIRGPYPGNFGDILTPYVLWHAFGVMPRWTPARQAEGLCIGSIAKFAHAGTRVWGSGMPRAGDPLAPDAVWAAVRGPLSRAAVIAAGGAMGEVYGDGAVLLPEIHAPPAAKTHRIGIIPHVLQEKRLRRILAEAGLADEVKIISLLAAGFADIERVIADIRGCEEIVSTSLHGVIVAHAYGIPCQSARRIGAGEVAQDSFKMRDYKASVGLDDAPIGIPERFETLDWLEARRCVLPPHPIDTARLRAAFPFETPHREAPDSAGARDALARTLIEELRLTRRHGDPVKAGRGRGHGVRVSEVRARRTAQASAAAIVRGPALRGGRAMRCPRSPVAGRRRRGGAG